MSENEANQGAVPSGPTPLSPSGTPTGPLHSGAHPAGPTDAPGSAAPGSAAPGSAAPGREWSRPGQSPSWPPPPASPPASGYPPVPPTPPVPSSTTASLPTAQLGSVGGYQAASGPYPGSHNPYGTPYPAPTHVARPGGPGSSRVVRGVVAGVAALAIALTAGGVGGFVGYGLHDDGSPVQLPAANSGNNNNAPVVDRSSLASIAAALQPTIVGVKTNAGEGSGVVMSADGNIVTNNHVVAGARSVSVTFNSGKTLPARVVGTDPQTDLAVLKVDQGGLTFAKWADSDSVRVGDTVLAIGSPLGLQGSVTAGIVSALHRTITVGGEQRTQFDTAAQTTIGDAIQTDAPINPGNSGGALVNTNGEIIGINSAIATQGQSSGNIGVGFAISANKAKSVTDLLAKGQTVPHPYLGVSIGDSDTGGAKIQSVEAGGPAAKAGLAAGDVVTKVGDRPITTAEDLIGAIQGSTVGAELKLTLQRGGSEQTVSVTVGQK